MKDAGLLDAEPIEDSEDGLLGALVILGASLEPALFNVSKRLSKTPTDKDDGLKADAPACCARAVVAAAGVVGTNVAEMLLNKELAAAGLLA